jgi:putative transposase
MFTFSCYQRRQLLEDERACRLLSQSLVRTLSPHRDRGRLLIGFVFMPEHVHLVMLPRSKDCSAPALLQAIKRPMAFRYKELLLAEGSPLVAELTIRERPGKFTFRFWQEGPGHDANLDEDGGIRRALHYVHQNPVERKLCAKPEDWPWSSARQYLGLPALNPFVPRVVRMTDEGLRWDDPAGI